jgi:hypothetical protein
VKYSGNTCGTPQVLHFGHDQLKNAQSTRLGSYTNRFNFDGAGNPTTFKGVAQTFNLDNQNNAYTFDGDSTPCAWKGNVLIFAAGNHLIGIGTLLTAGYNA